jgi:hypothetical protein
MVTGAEVKGFFFLRDVDVAACARGVDVAPSSGQWAPRDSVLFLYFSHSMSSSFADLDFKFIEQKNVQIKLGFLCMVVFLEYYNFYLGFKTGWHTIFEIAALQTWHDNTSNEGLRQKF